LARSRAEYEARWARERAQREQQEQAWAEARARVEAETDGGPRPSTHNRGYWIFADRRAGEYPEGTERRGKWMVFVPVARVDDWWARIKRAVEEGRLGRSAKVATARPNPHAINPAERVICVYTYDAIEDKADTMRVREELRALGVTWPISYKLDSATAAGQYARTGARASLYRV
jgi:hypothetical protein